MVINQFQNNFTKSVELEKNTLFYLILSFVGILFLNWLSVLMQFDNANLSNEIYYWAGLTLTTPIIYLSFVPFIRTLHLSGYRFSIEVPLMLLLLLVYFYSLYMTVDYTDGNTAYFDCILAILFIWYACQYLRHITKKRIHKLVEKHSHFPQVRAKRLQADDQYHPIELKDIAIGDKLFIAPGEYFPVDGIICDHDTSVDESMLTGEAHAIAKFAEDTVRAGTCNLDNGIVIQATSTFSNSYLGKMLSSMQETNAKANIVLPLEPLLIIQQMVTIGLVAAIYCWWLPLDNLYALNTAVILLLMACPLSIAIGTPLTIAFLLEALNKRGILVPSPLSFLKLNHLDYILFDKTGTLTEGNLCIDEIEYCNLAQENEVLPLIATIEKNTNHPIAHAIVKYANQRFSDFPKIDIHRLRVFPGSGIRALVNGKFILIGSARWLRKNGVFVPNDVIESQDQLLNRDRIFVHCAIGGIEVARILLKDKLRQDATQVIQFLKDRHIEMSVLSGDRPVIVNAIAKQLGQIPAFSQALPQDKEAQVVLLQDQGFTTAMVGDGLNDARALQRADIGISLGSRDPITLLSSDVILQKDGLKCIQDCFTFAGKARQIIKQNHLFGFAYTILMIPFTLVLHPSPMITLASICFSALVVMSNSARLLNIED